MAPAGRLAERADSQTTPSSIRLRHPAVIVGLIAAAIFTLWAIGYAISKLVEYQRKNRRVAKDVEKDAGKDADNDAKQDDNGRGRRPKPNITFPPGTKYLNDDCEVVGVECEEPATTPISLVTESSWLAQGERAVLFVNVPISIARASAHSHQEAAMARLTDANYSAPSLASSIPSLSSTTSSIETSILTPGEASIPLPHVATADVKLEPGEASIPLPHVATGDVKLEPVSPTTHHGSSGIMDNNGHATVPAQPSSAGSIDGAPTGASCRDSDGTLSDDRPCAATVPLKAEPTAEAPGESATEGRGRGRGSGYEVWFSKAAVPETVGPAVDSNNTLGALAPIAAEPLKTEPTSVEGRRRPRPSNDELWFNKLAALNTGGPAAKANSTPGPLAPMAIVPLKTEPLFDSPVESTVGNPGRGRGSLPWFKDPAVLGVSDLSSGDPVAAQEEKPGVAAGTIDFSAPIEECAPDWSLPWSSPTLDLAPTVIHAL